MFRRLLTFDEAKKAISKHLQTEPLGEQLVPLLEAHNHVLAENITSSLDIPPFDRSTVDGYAVEAEDTYGAEENNPIRLKICGVVNVGELPLLSIEKGGAAEIVTGAPIPEGADSVVMVEDTERDDDGLRVFSAVARDENVMKKGTDIRRGVIVLKAGQVLGSSEIGVIAALGLTKVKVFRAPMVAVLSTGGEVTEPGKDLPPGKIYDINAYSLSAAVLESGGKPVYLGVVPDDKTALGKALENALSSADIVLTSGGVSVGPKDITPQTIDSLGKPGLVVCGVAVKPGKPIAVAFVGRKPVFSMPGHPTSALLMFHLFVRPVIQLLSGRSVQEISAVKAVAGARMFSAKGRRTFVMVRLKRDKSNGFIAEPVETGASGAITTLAKADGFVEIPENQQFVDAEEEITVSLLRNVQGL
jgi:molybdenum cofactor synthesis domain-containing protein